MRSEGESGTGSQKALIIVRISDVILCTIKKKKTLGDIRGGNDNSGFWVEGGLQEWSQGEETKKLVFKFVQVRK